MREKVDTEIWRLRRNGCIFRRIGVLRSQRMMPIKIVQEDLVFEAQIVSLVLVFVFGIPVVPAITVRLHNYHITCTVPWKGIAKSSLFQRHSVANM